MFVVFNLWYLLGSVNLIFFIKGLNEFFFLLCMFIFFVLNELFGLGNFKD